MKSKPILALLLVFCVFATVPAQTKPPAPPQSQKTSDDKDDDVVRITTNLVQVDAVVTKDGKLVPNLTADDFEIYEDGKKQTITSFAFISNVPTTTAEPPANEKANPGEVAPIPRLKRDDPRRTVAFVVDDLGLSAESMHTVRHELRKFIAKELQPNDLVAVMRTSGELGALQQFTNDKRLLDRAVDRLRWNICSRAGVSVLPRFDSDRSRFEDSDFSCWGDDSYTKTLMALRFILNAMGQLPGRKSMVILSDSLPIETQELRFENEALNNTFPNTRRFEPLVQKIAEKAIRASVVIYAVDTQGLQYPGPTAADNINMTRANMDTVTSDIIRTRSALLRQRREGGQLIAEQTGGFQVRNSNSFQLTRILQEQNGYYLLGYRPTSETFNRRFHHIKAKVKRSGMTLRTRFGFFGVSEEEIGPMQLFNPTSTNLALMSPFGAQDIEVDLISFFTHDKAAGPTIRSFVYIDPRGLTFKSVNGMRQASFELHGVIFGDNGSIAEYHEGGATLTLAERDYEVAMRNGIATPLDMRVKRPGSYQVRVATRDRSSGKIGSAGQFVEVPDLNRKRLAVSGIVLGTAESAGPDVNKMIERPGERSFDRNTDLHFAFVTYNAASMSNLVMEAKLFRDGKAVYSAPATPVNLGNQTDLSRVLVSGSVGLSPDLELGSYYLQVVITDKTPKSKMVSVVQWIDFDIVR